MLFIVVVLFEIDNVKVLAYNTITWFTFYIQIVMSSVLEI